ncbi:hypothetical protein GCM10009780_56040 [Actinomadura alba]
MLVTEQFAHQAAYPRHLLAAAGDDHRAEQVEGRHAAAAWVTVGAARSELGNHRFPLAVPSWVEKVGAVVGGKGRAAALPVERGARRERDGGQPEPQATR